MMARYTPDHRVILFFYTVPQPYRYCDQCGGSATGYVAWDFTTGDGPGRVYSEYEHVCNEHAETTFEMRCLESVTG